MPRIMNDAHEAVATVVSDAEAVRWWRENGRPGDYLEDTDELLRDLDDQLGLDA